MNMYFYQNRTDSLPWDGYPAPIDMPGALVFAVENWLKMYPNGRVEFCQDILGVTRK